MEQDFSRTSLELLYDISRDLTSSLDLQTILSRVLHLSTKNVGAERGSIIVLDRSQQPVDAAIVYKNKLIQHTHEQLKNILMQGLAGWVVWNHKAALVPDTSQDIRWLLRPDDSEDRSGAKSAICLPLLSRDELVGVLTVVHPQPLFFNQEHFDLLKSIADMAGIAVYNAMLYETIQTLSNRYRDLFEDSIDAIVLTDWQGKIIQANRRAEHTSQYSMQQLLQHTIFELHRINNEILGQDLRKLDSLKTISYESELKLLDQSTIPIEVHVRKVTIDGTVNIQWILRDISERKALENMQEDLTAMVYHDMRSPLSNIQTSIEMLETILPDSKDKNIKTVLSVLSRSVERVQRLVNSILDIHRLEASQPITNTEEVKMVDLLYEIADIIQPAIETKQQNFQLNIPDTFPVLRLDADMIKRVMINLLENAVKYSPENGNILLEGCVEKDHAKIWVQDSGPGIPAESQDMIFNKFARLQASGFPKGIGLGLAFCRLAVEAHGGKIWVESCQDKGSRFVISFPIDSAKENPA